MVDVKISDRSRGRSKKKRGLWLGVLFAFLGLLVLGAVALFLLLPRILLGIVEREARAQGVVLEDCSLAYTLSQVTLEGCAFKLVDLESVSGSLGTVEVSIVDFKPTAVVVKEPAIVVRELPDVPAGERVPKWLEQRAKLGKDRQIPLRIERGRLDLFGVSEVGPDKIPLVTLTDVEFDSVSENLSSNISIGGMIAGKLTHKAERSALDLHLKLSPATKFRISVETQPEGAEVRADFESLPLSLFALPPLLQLPDALMAVQADGQLYATVPFGLDTKGVRGDLRATLIDLPMPVPLEIQGLVYSPEARFETKFKLHPNNQDLEFSDTKLQAGVLKLKGNGRLELHDGTIPLNAQLSGSLSCGAILESATKAHTDSPLALAAAQLARGAIEGGVGIVVVLDADLLRLKEARLLKTIGVGCGLKPLPLPKELQGLGDKIREGLSKPPRLPDLPELRLPEPRLPKPPDLGLPKLPDFGRNKEKQLDQGADPVAPVPSR